MKPHTIPMSSFIDQIKWNNDGLVPVTEIKKVDCWDTEKNNSVVPRQVTKS